MKFITLLTGCSDFPSYLNEKTKIYMFIKGYDNNLLFERKFMTYETQIWKTSSCLIHSLASEIIIVLTQNNNLVSGILIRSLYFFRCASSAICSRNDSFLGRLGRHLPKHSNSKLSSWMEVLKSSNETLVS